MASLLPPDLPPMAGKALKDPTSLGLDVTEPIQIHVIPDAEKDVAPIWGIAGKISNRENSSTRWNCWLGWTSQSKKMDIMFSQKLTSREQWLWGLVQIFYSLGIR